MDSSTRFDGALSIADLVDGDDLVHVRPVPADRSIHVSGIGDWGRRQRGKFVTRGLAAQDHVSGKVSLGVRFPDETDGAGRRDQIDGFRRGRRKLVDRRDAGGRRWRAFDCDRTRHFDAPHDVATLDAELDSRIAECRRRQKRSVQGQNRCRGSHVGHVRGFVRRRGCGRGSYLRRGDGCGIIHVVAETGSRTRQQASRRRTAGSWCVLRPLRLDIRVDFVSPRGLLIGIFSGGGPTTGLTGAAAGVAGAASSGCASP